jgi:lipoprotein-anchoring transpeptidase ErfK/SrfK
VFSVKLVKDVGSLHKDRFVMWSFSRVAQGVVGLLLVTGLVPLTSAFAADEAQPAYNYGWGLAPANQPLDKAVQHKTTTGNKAPVKAPIRANVMRVQPAVAALPVSTVPATRKIVIDIPSRTLSVMDGNTVLKRFPVGVGRLGFMTPLGKHAVIHKVENPGWENPYKAAGAVTIRPGMNNPLGTRWIGFKETPQGEFGIHGTDSPNSVGKLSSHGCVRMLVPHAEQVYALVDVGTPVEVTYQTVHIAQTPAGEIKVTRYPDWFKRGVPSLVTVQQDIAKRFGPQAMVNVPQLQAALSVLPPEKPVVVGRLTTAVDHHVNDMNTSSVAAPALQ